MRSISASAATKRRGAALAAVVGILTLGTAASASAVGLSPNAPARTATKVSVCAGWDTGSATPVGDGAPTDPSEPTDPSVPSDPTDPSVPTGPSVPSKPAKDVTAIKVGKLARPAGAEAVGSEPVGTSECSVSTIPTDEGSTNSHTPFVPVTPAKK